MSTFFERLEARTKTCDSFLCVGLDPHWKEILPGVDDVDSVDEQTKCDAAFSFCENLVKLTAPHAAAFKPNAAFFEALGPNLGVSTLCRVIKTIPDDIPVLLDVKRGDIGSTASAYADACYDKNGLNADAVTLSPLMGWDSVKPFVTGAYAHKGAFVLCKTSNPGSNDVLALDLRGGETVYERIARLSVEWSAAAAAESSSSTTTPPRVGLVVGATDAVALAAARRAAGPDTWILAPGVGAQGGDADAACAAGANARGGNLLVPVSRGVSRAADPARAAEELKETIRRALARAATTTTDAVVDPSSPPRMRGYQEEFIEFSLAQGVLKFGSFRLKSGRTSPYFFNAGLFATGGALLRLGKAYAATIMASELLVKDGTPQFDVVFGPAYKGITLAAIVSAQLYADHGLDVGCAYNRKEAKDHGEGGTLVGAPIRGKRVLVIDDVITAGTAVREAHGSLTSEDHGATVVGVVIALDRAEKRSLDDPVSAVQAAERDLDVPVVSIVSLPQLQAFLQARPDYGEETLSKIVKYRADYGV